MRISDWSSDVCSSDLIEPRPDLDVFLFAPKGPGTALREEYLKDGGLISLFAVHKDSTGSARALALSYAAALGSGRVGTLETSFAEECEADLFNEQAVLWGAIPELIHAGFDTLVERSEEHTSELQSLMRISYAVFC